VTSILFHGVVKMISRIPEVRAAAVTARQQQRDGLQALGMMRLVKAKWAI